MASLKDLTVAIPYSGSHPEYLDYIAVDIKVSVKCRFCEFSCFKVDQALQHVIETHKDCGSRETASFQNGTRATNYTWQCSVCFTSFSEATDLAVHKQSDACWTHSTIPSRQSRMTAKQRPDQAGKNGYIITDLTSDPKETGQGRTSAPLEKIIRKGKCDKYFWSPFPRSGTKTTIDGEQLSKKKQSGRVQGCSSRKTALLRSSPNDSSANDALRANVSELEQHRKESLPGRESREHITGSLSEMVMVNCFSVIESNAVVVFYECPVCFVTIPDRSKCITHLEHCLRKNPSSKPSEAVRRVQVGNFSSASCKQGGRRKVIALKVNVPVWAKSLEKADTTSEFPLTANSTLHDTTVNNRRVLSAKRKSGTLPSTSSTKKRARPGQNALAPCGNYATVESLAEQSMTSELPLEPDLSILLPSVGETITNDEGHTVVLKSEPPEVDSVLVHYGHPVFPGSPQEEIHSNETIKEEINLNEAVQGLYNWTSSDEASQAVRSEKPFNENTPEEEGELVGGVVVYVSEVL